MDCLTAERAGLDYFFLTAVPLDGAGRGVVLAAVDGRVAPDERTADERGAEERTAMVLREADECVGAEMRGGVVRD